MKVRMASEKDIARMHVLLSQVELVHHKGRPDLFKCGGQKYTDEELREILKDKDRPILAAVDDEDCLQGYAFCMFQQHKESHVLTDIKTLYIDDLCVDENVRGQHVGTLLYEAVLDFARAHGCYNVTLNVWSCNESAMKFYRARGLKEQKVGMEVIL
ncbi:MAG TPA: GNAT family N-acetyltransferase [Candidatus Choladousia intestinipullorum]|nr:GNAT family N-acetyltransferase [Candidatus Choladousia intestinipullorum]